MIAVETNPYISVHTYKRKINRRRQRKLLWRGVKNGKERIFFLSFQIKELSKRNLLYLKQFQFLHNMQTFSSRKAKKITISNNGKRGLQKLTNLIIIVRGLSPETDYNTSYANKSGEEISEDDKSPKRCDARHSSTRRAFQYIHLLFRH